MPMKKAINLLVVAAAAGSHLLTGSLVSWFGKVFVEYLSPTDVDLPVITKFFLSYTTSGAAMIVCLILAILIAIAYPLSKRITKIDAFPLALSISYIIAFLHIGTAAFSVVLPFLRITTQMGND